MYRRDYLKYGPLPMTVGLTGCLDLQGDDPGEAPNGPDEEGNVTPTETPPTTTPDNDSSPTPTQDQKDLIGNYLLGEDDLDNWRLENERFLEGGTPFYTEFNAIISTEQDFRHREDDLRLGIGVTLFDDPENASIAYKALYEEQQVDYLDIEEVNLGQEGHGFNGPIARVVFRYEDRIGDASYTVMGDNGERMEDALVFAEILYQSWPDT